MKRWVQNENQSRRPSLKTLLLKTTVISVVCWLLVGCNSHSRVTEGPKYFDSTASAVEQIAIMLEGKNWPELAHYYDLTNTSINRETLVSGEFFYTDEEPAAAHPAGFWHYKHPFPPAFKFHSYRQIEEPGLIEVTVMVEIDQGGGMIQRGVQTFLMRKTEKGHQVIPDKAPAL